MTPGEETEGNLLILEFGAAADLASEMTSRILNWIGSPEDWERLDAAVWVSVKKLDQSWQRDLDYYVGRGGIGAASDHKFKYDRFGKWIERGEPIEMPVVCIDQNRGEIGFTNGRHRFAWLRDHGVRAVRIQVPPDQAQLIVARFGTRLRTSRLRTSGPGMNKLAVAGFVWVLWGEFLDKAE